MILLKPFAPAACGLFILSTLGCTEPRYFVRQLTTDTAHHFLNHTQVWGPADSVLVVDNRPHDSLMRLATGIGLVNVYTGHTKWVHTVPANRGLGAATFRPGGHQILFLEGLETNGKQTQYSTATRSGKLMTLATGELSHLDLRNPPNPAAGQHAGGTHAHSWNREGTMVSSTYNDLRLQELAAKNKQITNLRTVVVSWPHEEAGLPWNTGNLVSVFQDDGHTEGRILKAYDECWLPYRLLPSKPSHPMRVYRIAFQGLIRENGKLKTEVFVKKFSYPVLKDSMGLKSSDSLHLAEQIAGPVERITHSQNGIEGPRHWLRYLPQMGSLFYLQKDSLGKAQLYGTNLLNKTSTRYSFEPDGILGQANFSADGKFAVYPTHAGLVLLHLRRKKAFCIYPIDSKIGHMPGPASFSADGQRIVFALPTPAQGKVFQQIIVLETRKAQRNDVKKRKPQTD